MEHFVVIFRLLTFSVFYFHPHFFIQLGYFFLFFFLSFIVLFFLHISIVQVALVISIAPKMICPPINYMEARIFFPFFDYFFFCLMSSHFTNTTCIETLHRPICFHFFFFLNVRIQLFLMSF